MNAHWLPFTTIPQGSQTVVGASFLLVADECRSRRHQSHAQTAEQEGLPSNVLDFGRIDGRTICSVFVTVVSVADMWMSMGNRFVPMRMRVPVETICLHPVRFSIGMLVGMVRVLVAKVVEVLVLMPHLVMAVPMGVVFLQQQNNAANHQGTCCDQVGVHCFLECKHSKTCSNKRCCRKDH